MDFNRYMAEKKRLVELKLTSLVPEDNKIPVITEAMRYSLFAGGKRLRPILALMSCELFGGPEEEVLPFACCIEMIHAYSLIHDDLPAMDNDDLRRGKPTNHRVFGEGFAVLAGDALLNQAFETIIGIIINKPSHEYIRAANIICKSAGISGMIGGQCIDLYYEKKSIDVDTLKNMHAKKTGALITASLAVGAVLSGAEEGDIINIMEFGELIGLAFQVADDILDVSGSENKLGKKINKDAEFNKSNFISFYGLEKSEEIAKELVDEAKLKLEGYGSRGRYLCELSDYIITRDE
ncbi:MAG TPA: polyprenyl synthetase family protein [Bacillota bacterium]|mgnify:CR=1 FL=1|nr:polyprenyl synthetase family protein [Bacillota bacterium]HPL52774.1 polyprenyl synthetase family protein [Bacillota bacterium]